MLICMIGDNYAYNINKYATCRVFYVQERKYFSRSISFLFSILEPPPIVCTKFFNGRIEEGTYCLLRKYNFRHVIPLSKTTSIFRGIFQLSL